MTSLSWIIAPLLVAASPACAASAQTAPAGYWTATSPERVAPPSEMLPAGALPMRRVMVSGYHPLAGFEAETAAEDAAAHDSKMPSSGTTGTR